MIQPWSGLNSGPLGQLFGLVIKHWFSHQGVLWPFQPQKGQIIFSYALFLGYGFHVRSGDLSFAKNWLHVIKDAFLKGQTI